MSSLPRDVLADLAAELDRARRQRQPIPRITERLPDLSIEDAYAIQRQLVALALPDGGRIVGAKAGLTSPAKQEAMGVREPIYGRLLSGMVIEEGQPLDAALLIHPRAEPEVAFVLDRDLEGPDVTEEAVLHATQWLVPAIEIIDSRYAGFSFTLADVVADNASSAYVLLSPLRASKADIDLAGLRVTFEKNGAQVDEGTGEAVLGHPARAVAWLARELHRHGERLRAGDVVLPGAICNAHPVASGDRVRAVYEDWGTLELRCK